MCCDIGAPTFVKANLGRLITGESAYVPVLGVLTLRGSTVLSRFVASAVVSKIIAMVPSTKTFRNIVLQSVLCNKELFIGRKKEILRYVAP